MCNTDKHLYMICINNIWQQKTTEKSHLSRPLV